MDDDDGKPFLVRFRDSIDDVWWWCCCCRRRLLLLLAPATEVEGFKTYLLLTSSSSSSSCKGTNRNDCIFGNWFPDETGRNPTVIGSLIDLFLLSFPCWIFESTDDDDEIGDDNEDDDDDDGCKSNIPSFVNHIGDFSLLWLLLLSLSLLLTTPVATDTHLSILRRL